MGKGIKGTMDVREYYQCRKSMVEELCETKTEPFAFWYDRIVDEYYVYQNDAEGKEELLFLSDSEEEVVGFLYLCLLLQERGCLFKHELLTEAVG